MTQLRRHSLLESCLNTASGFLVSYLAWPIVCRFVLHVPFDAGQGLEAICFFTVLSVVRNYAWRRIFNWRARRRWDQVLYGLCERRHAEKTFPAPSRLAPVVPLRPPGANLPEHGCGCPDADSWHCALQRKLPWRHCPCPCHSGLAA